MADTYTPTSGMKAAARRALKWKADGKAKGAGTPVGWGRATDIVNGSVMSLSTVKRMYSFFSRHEVDKKGKGFLMVQIFHLMEESCGMLGVVMQDFHGAVQLLKEKKRK